MNPTSTPRVVGIDVARAIAVFGMFTAHIADRSALTLPNGSSALEAFDGRSASGFALLAGVSAALLSGGSRPCTGPRMTHARVRVVARAALLWPLGLALVALKTPMAVILPTYAVLFAVIAAFLSVRPWVLAVAAAAVAAFGPVALLQIRDHIGPEALVQTDVQAVDFTQLTVGYCYPVLVWPAYLLAGLAIGRLDLNSTRVRGWMLGSGIAAATVAFVTNAVAMRTVDPSRTFWRALLTTEPHSASPVEVLANTGVAVTVLVLCLVLSDRFGRAVAPLAATGAFALTAYCGHLVAIAWIGTVIWREPDNLLLLRFIVVTMVVAWLWRRFLGRGPLELMMNAESTAVADAIVPAGRRDVTPARPPAVGPGPDPDSPPSTDPHADAPAGSALSGAAAER